MTLGSVSLYLSVQVTQIGYDIEPKAVTVGSWNLLSLNRVMPVSIDSKIDAGPPYQVRMSSQFTIGFCN